MLLIEISIAAFTIVVQLLGGAFVYGRLTEKVSGLEKRTEKIESVVFGD